MQANVRIWCGNCNDYIHHATLGPNLKRCDACGETRSNVIALGYLSQRETHRALFQKWRYEVGLLTDLVEEVRMPGVWG